MSTDLSSCMQSSPACNVKMQKIIEDLQSLIEIEEEEELEASENPPSLSHLMESVREPSLGVSSSSSEPPVENLVTSPHRLSVLKPSSWGQIDKITDTCISNWSDSQGVKTLSKRVAVTVAKGFTSLPYTYRPEPDHGAVMGLVYRSVNNLKTCPGSFPCPYPEAVPDGYIKLLSPVYPLDCFLVKMYVTRVSHGCYVDPTYLFTTLFDKMYMPALSWDIVRDKMLMAMMIWTKKTAWDKLGQSCINSCKTLSSVAELGLFVRQESSEKSVFRQFSGRLMDLLLRDTGAISLVTSWGYHISQLSFLVTTDVPYLVLCAFLCSGFLLRGL